MTTARSVGIVIECEIITFEKILSLCHGVNKMLQSSTINVVECCKAITGLMTSISDIRTRSHRGTKYVIGGSDVIIASSNYILNQRYLLIC